MNSSNKMFSINLSIPQQDLSCRVVSKREKEISVATIETNRKMEKRKNEKGKKKKRNKNLSVFEADTSKEHILERRNSF